MHTTSERTTPGGIRVRTRVFRSHESTPLHEHERPFVCFVVAGVSEQVSGAREHVRTPGRAFFYPAHEKQTERFDGRGGYIFAADLLPAQADLSRSSHEISGPAAVLARRLYIASLREDDFTIDDSSASLAGLLAGERCDDRWIDRAREYVHAHFASRLSLADIAGAVHVHPVHLCRSFPRRFGMTVGDYLRALRIDYASRELAATRRPIADIALDAGFASQAHLTRHFTEMIGIAPAAYRLAC